MENDEAGYILISKHTEYIEPYHEQVNTLSYSWRGGQKCSISVALMGELHPDGISAPHNLQLGDTIRFGPYRIIVTDIGMFRDMVKGRRVDSEIECIFWSGRIRLMNWLYMVYKIILFTGVVWKLVDYDPAVQTSWRDFKLLKRWVKR